MASKLAENLQPYAPTGVQWTVFDRELITRILDDRHLSRRLADFFPESGKSFVGEIIDEVLGRHPPTTDIIRQSAESIWKLADGGYVILVGRAANIITAKLDNVFHVRLIGSVPNRTARLQTVYDFDHAAALQYLKAQDAAKKRYVKEYFGKDIDDPLLYHMTINTDTVGYDQAARLITDAMIRRFKLDSPTTRTA